MKHLKRALAVLLSVTLIVSVFILNAGAANLTLGEPIPLTSENEGVADTTRGNALLHNGYFTQDIVVGDVTRTVKVYIGSNAQLRCYFTVLNVPDGLDTTEFLEKSGWAQLAEERGEGLFVLEPGANGWGSYAQEEAYLTAAFAAYNERTWYSNFSTSYLVGYGKGGQSLQQYAMANSMAMIGGVFVNASEIDGTYLQQVGKTVLSDGTTTLSQVPMPVWLINEIPSTQNQAVIDYWKVANDCVETGATLDDGSIQFDQRSDSDSIVTSYSNTRSKVRVLEEAVDIYSPTFTQSAYEFMCGYTRYETAVIGGNSLGVRPDYQDMGLEIHEFEMDGLVREYILYVPESVKTSGEKAPLVLLMGGSNQPNRIIFDATHWWEIADREGFIIVSPCAWSDVLRWNNTGDPTQRDDLKFIEYVLDDVISNYPVDTTRCYATGQSNGAVMTEFLAQQIPERFAAVAATSGGLIEQELYAQDNGNAMIPTYLFFGEFDNWSYDFTQAGEVRTLVNYFGQRNRTSPVDAPDSRVADGRFITYGWANDSGITLVQLTQTLGRPHNCIPSEMELAWDWFQQWSRGADGTLYHNGQAVNETKNEPISQMPSDGKGQTVAKEYTVVKGDTLWGIAQRFYQDGTRYMDIFRANQDHIAEADKIYVGQTLVIPGV